MDLTLEEIKEKTLEQVTIPACRQNECQVDVVLELWQAISPPCVMRAVVDGKEILAHEFDFFECLCRIREGLEKVQTQLRCYGASENVFPSYMARDMGMGRQAYKLKLGQRATTDDLVDIFSSGEDMLPCSVAQQARFYKQWHTSLIPGGSKVVKFLRKLKKKIYA